MDMQIDQNLEANSRLQYPPVSAIKRRKIKIKSNTKSRDPVYILPIAYPESVKDCHLNAKNTPVQRPSTAR
jgi:hypothetical protein